MLTRILFILGIVLVAVDIYALADIAMTQRARIRTLPRLVWALVVLITTPVGAILWFTLGKLRRTPSETPFLAPDDDPDFRVPESETADERIARLEEELRRLDEEDNNPPSSEGR